MIGKSPVRNQRDVFLPLLVDIINTEHKLAKLADAIDWSYFENAFAGLYSSTGQPAMPVRLMVGCLLLKRIENLGDETLAERWVRDPYMQYFCGEAYFRHGFPCDPSDFSHFRKRIGESGAEKIFAYSVDLHGKNAHSKIVCSDTTVQENFTTFPTDSKIARKVIVHCNAIAEKEGINQRQTYKRVSKQLLRDSYNGHHPRRAKKARKAQKSLRTIAGRLLRELERNLPEDRLAEYTPLLELYWKAVSQERTDKDKVYSLHKPFTACIAKGKAHKKFEFGNKVGLITHATRNIILAIKAFTGNPHDSKTIAPLLDQMQDHKRSMPEELIYDRGGKGIKEHLGVTITTPNKPKASDSESKRRGKRRRFRRRAAIEPIIGHLKTDHRLGQNYLHGEKFIQMNAYLAAAGWNMKKWMEKVSRKGKPFLWLLIKWLNIPQRKLLFLSS